MLQLLQILGSDPKLFVVLVIAISLSLVAGLSFHEFSHAVVADALGDGTPRRMGRLSLNPAVHLDPFGTVMLVLAGFGWAKPVPVSPFSLRPSPKVGMALVALAGPAANFLLAAAFAAPLKTGALQLAGAGRLDEWTFGNYLAFPFLQLVLINTLLGVFNMLPIPPMDGSRLAQLLPGEIGEFFVRMERERWGLGILMLLLFLPFLTGGRVDILGAIIRPVVTWVRARLLFG